MKYISKRFRSNINKIHIAVTMTRDVETKTKLVLSISIVNYDKSFHFKPKKTNI